MQAQKNQPTRQERDALLDVALGANPEPVWCPVANVVREHPYGPGGVETRHGTRLLAPGAKVYVFPHLWDSHASWARLMVIGRHRASQRYLTLVMPANLLTNWRVDLVYSPHVIREFLVGIMEQYWWNDQTPEENIARLRQITWSGTAEAKAKAEQMVALMRELFPGQGVSDMAGQSD